MTTEARLRLADQLCFAPYAATNAITRAYRPLLRELDITYPQYLTLMALWQHGSGTVSELARHLDLPADAMTPCCSGWSSPGSSRAGATPWTAGRCSTTCAQPPQAHR